MKRRDAVTHRRRLSREEINIDNPTQLYVTSFDTAIPIANMGKTFGMSTTTGSTQSGQSSNMMLLAGGSATANTWRTVRIAEDPENDENAAFRSVVVCLNLIELQS